MYKVLKSVNIVQIYVKGSDMEFFNVNDMSKEDIIKEISDLELILDIVSKVTVDGLLSKSINLDILSKYNLTITPNGQLFDISSEGFLPQMLGMMYNDRKKYKKLMLQAEQEYEEATDDIKKKELENKISRYQNLQLTKKVCL